MTKGKIVTKNYPNPDPNGNVLLEIVAAANDNKELRKAIGELPPGTYSIFALNRAAVIVGEVPARKRVDFGPAPTTRKPKSDKVKGANGKGAKP
jgi:hypothetical protein